MHEFLQHILSLWRGKKAYLLHLSLIYVPFLAFRTPFSVFSLIPVSFHLTFNL